MRLPRILHRIYAPLLGYFWLPCPLCGQQFGGHEWKPWDGRPSLIADPTRDPGCGIGICPACTREGKGER